MRLNDIQLVHFGNIADNALVILVMPDGGSLFGLRP